MRLGICCGLGSFAGIQDAPVESLPQTLDAIRAAGADYVEFTVGTVVHPSGDHVYEAVRKIMERAPLKAEAFNSFIPPTLPLTGPQAGHEAALAFAKKALERCKALGGEVVVLGSGAARRAPAGFDLATAKNQFNEFVKRLGDVAERAGIDIALEPLNSREDNICFSVAQGAQLVDALAHPRIKLLADLFHMSEERESLEVVTRAGARLIHAHVADLGRVAPGYAPGGEANFRGFFRALKRARYSGRVSFEGTMEDLNAQAGPLMRLLRQRLAESQD